jgi:hypothetical protein
MRMSRGTIALIVVALAVIVAVLIFNASPASAPPSPTATPGSASAGPLFPDVSPATIAALTVDAPASGLNATYRRGSDGAWTLDGDSTGYTLDAKSLDDQMTALSGMASFDTFSSDQLANYGLDAPIGVITVQLADGTTRQLVVGGTNPTGNRRYVVVLSVNAEATPEATAEATLSADATVEAATPLLTGAQSISTVVSSTVQGWLDLLTTPPYQPTATPAPTLAATPTPEATAEATSAALDISTPVVEPTPLPTDSDGD